MKSNTTNRRGLRLLSTLKITNKRNTHMEVIKCNNK